MAESQEPTKTPSLSEQYALKDNDEKVDVDTKSVAVKEAEVPETADPEEPPPAIATASVDITEVAPAAAVEESSESPPPPEVSEESTQADPPAVEAAVVEESSESSPPSATEETNQADPPAAETDATEESSDNTDSSAAEETVPRFKTLETAPPDPRFPTTNQTRHCFTRYIEYHRCVAAKGEGAPECDKFQRYYHSLCPNDWVERWDEQRENGTFPGPL